MTYANPRRLQESATSCHHTAHDYILARSCIPRPFIMPDISLLSDPIFPQQCLGASPRVALILPITVPAVLVFTGASGCWNTRCSHCPILSSLREMQPDAVFSVVHVTTSTAEMTAVQSPSSAQLTIHICHLHAHFSTWERSKTNAA